MVQSIHKQKPIDLLIVDDEESILTSLEFLLRRQYRITTARSAEEALAHVEKGIHFPVVLSDQRMPGAQGHELLKSIHEHSPETVGILVTGYSDMESLVKAVNEGHIYGYIAKPWNPEELKLLISRAVERYNLGAQNVRLAEDLSLINRELEQRVTERTKELELKNKLLERQQQMMRQELEQAQITQHALLPKTLPLLPHVEFATKYVPMDKIGGDIYDVFELGDHKIGIVLADVTGHGVPAALISFMVANLFKTYAPQFESPVSMMETINNALFGRLPPDKFTTAFYCSYDAKNQIISYISAGHPAGYVIRKNTAELFRLKGRGGILGIFPGNVTDAFESCTFQLLPGDKVFLYTDGILEIENETKGIFGHLRLEKKLIEIASLPIKELLDTIYECALQYSGKSNFNDDVTLVGLEILAS